MNIINKYANSKPGVYTEYVDKSILPEVTLTGTSVIVIGSSKKGPVNTIVPISSQTELETMFGKLDTSLERKGSYFHRTISKEVRTNPVLALNLLKTSDVLDTVEYMSLSTATDVSNDIKRTAPYRRMHNTTGFWKKDTESFLNVVNDDLGADSRLFSITNMSDKDITVFIFKSSITGYDVTMLDYYGTVDAIPTYLDSKEFVSDYLVDVVVVSGNWNDYVTLSNDSRWSKYFNADGILKTQVNNFVNDRGVNLIQYYEGVSLIPFFLDNDRRNIFIENVINSETDMTGLFCAFDIDKFETDFTNGKIDLIGHNLINTNSLLDSVVDSVNFLSYDVKLTEKIKYSNQVLDAAGGTTGQNVLAFGAEASILRNNSISNETRTTHYAELYHDGLQVNSVNPSSDSYTLSFSTYTPNNELENIPYYVVNGVAKSLNYSGGVTISFTTVTASTPTFSATVSYTDLYYINSVTNEVNAKKSTTPNEFPSIVNNNDIVLGYIQYDKSPSSEISSVNYTSVSLGEGYDELNSNDFTIDDLGSGKFKLEMLGTAVSNSSRNYVANRRIRLFNKLVSILDSPNKDKGSIIIDGSLQTKHSLENVTISNIITSTSQNKSITIDLGLGFVPTFILDGGIAIYKLDNELYFKGEMLETSNSLPTSTSGIVAKYSDLYQDIYNGNISTGDVFYKTIGRTNIYQLIDYTDGYSYVILPKTAWLNDFNGDEVISIEDLNMTISIDGATDYHSTINTSLMDDVDEYSTYRIKENITENITYNIQDVSKRIFDVKLGNEVYLKTDFFNDVLTVDFTDSDLITPKDVVTLNDDEIIITSKKTNYRQSIEIDLVLSTNKIVVNSERYTEVKKGDYLISKDYDAINGVDLPVGKVNKKLTRITSKTPYNSTQSVITTASDIYIDSTTMQTIRVTAIDVYVNTYKGMALKGFSIRTESLPDGTEERQNSILNLVSKGTPLFRAITNKNSIMFRYLIDSYGLGLTSNSKQQLVDIVGERKDALALINLPSMKQFKKSVSPTFVDEEGVLKAEYIKDGGNLESNPAFLYSFGDGDGAAYSAYFGPYLVVPGEGRSIEIPPAAYVGSTYLRKFNATNGNLKTFSIMAGNTNGRITDIIGLEQEFDDLDVETLLKANMNIITKKNNTNRYIIETEKTGLTLYKSSLSDIHSIEVLIEYSKEMQNMLLDYQFVVFNTPAVRAEIKLKADTISEKYKLQGAIFDYFNKCDSQNNTNEMIDRQIGLLENYVEIVKGLAVIVNRITTLSTGVISSTGFSANQ